MARAVNVVRLAPGDEQKVLSALRNMGGAHDRLADRIEKNSRKSARGTKALDRSVRDLKGNLMSFASRLPIIGGALAALGPAGIAAAAGIAAIGLGLGRALRIAREATRQFDATAKAARDLGVSSDLYQTLQLAADEASIPFERVNRAIQTFERNAAKATTGRGEMVEMLRASHGALVDEITALGSAEERLEAVRVALRGAQTQTERNLIATAAFGESGFAVARMLEEQESSMTELIARAREMGVVVDQSMLRRAEEMENRLGVAARVMDINFKQALVDLTPVLVSSAELMADLARVVRDVADAFKSIEDKTTSGMEAALERLEHRRARLAENQGGWFGAGRIRAAMLADVDAEIAAMRAELEDRRASAGDPAGAGDDPAAVRAAELQRMVNELRAAGVTPAMQLAEAMAELQEAYEAGVITSEAELARLQAIAREQHGGAQAARDRAQAERQAAEIRAEAGEITGLLALREAELSRLVERGTLDRDEATAALERYRATLDGTVDAQRRGEEVARSVETVQARLARREAELTELRDKGAITLGVYTRAMAAARREFEDADPAHQTAARVRERLATTAQRVAEEERAVAEAVRDGGLSHAEAERYLEAYRQEMERTAEAGRAARFETELLDRVLSGQVQSWRDLGRVAVEVLADIARQVIRTTEVSQGLGSFLSAVLGGVGQNLGVGGTPSGQFAAPSAMAGGGGGTPVLVNHEGGPNVAGYRARRMRVRSGLGPREYASVLEDGERIWKARDNAAVLNLMGGIHTALKAGGGPGAPVTVDAGLNVVVENHGEPGRVAVRERRSGDGRRELRILVTEAVVGGVAEGRFDQVLSERFGLTPQPYRR